MDETISGQFSENFGFMELFLMAPALTLSYYIAPKWPEM